jgi:xanthine dehydrogenase YagR molybdenum-binding subunit
MSIAARPIGADVARLDGPDKVTGSATYAYEHPLTDPAYAFAVLSTVARGRVARIDTTAAAKLPGVLAVLTHENVPRLADASDGELAILQSPEIHFRGQIVGAVVAESLEIAREAAALVRVEEQAVEHSAVLRAGDPGLYKPAEEDVGDPADTAHGDVEAGLRAAATTIDATYTTPIEHASPMEPHTSVALWRDGTLTLFESTQSVHGVRKAIAELFGIALEDVEVTAPYVGGGFGCKGKLHAPAVLAVMAAQAVAGRPVKLAVERDQILTLGGQPV